MCGRAPTVGRLAARGYRDYLFWERVAGKGKRKAC